jgi:hypothetical protein
VVNQVTGRILRVGVAPGVRRKRGKPFLDSSVRSGSIGMRAKEVSEQQCIPLIRAPADTDMNVDSPFALRL